MGRARPTSTRTPADRSVKTGALIDNMTLEGVGAAPYIISGKPWPPMRDLAAKARGLMDRTFDHAQPGMPEPRAIVTIGVMGSGKTTAVRKISRGWRQWRPALIDPDQIAIALLGKRKLPSGGDLYDLASKWTRRIWDHAIRGRYNIIYDSAVPSEHLLKSLRRAGYRIELLTVRASQPVARKREVLRDHRRGWGRPGVSERGHLSTQGDISKNGPKFAERYADTLTVCDNTGRVMKCVDLGNPRAASETDLAHHFRA